MRPLPFLLLFAGCGGGVADWYTDQPWVWNEVRVDVAPAFDPKLDGSPTLDIHLAIAAALPESCTVTLTARAVGGQAASLGNYPAPAGPEGLVVTWDGTIDGRPVDPGPLQLAADLRCVQRLAGWGEARTHIVRLGPGALDFRGDDKVPLAWHKTDLINRKVSVAPHDIAEWRLGDGPIALDDFDGQPLAGAAAWRDPHVPPWGAGDPRDLDYVNLPVAYPAGAGYTVRLTPGELAISAFSGVAVDARGPLETRGGAPTIRVISDELRALGDAEWSPGREVSFTSAAGSAVPSALGRHDLSLTWRFEAFDGQDWVEIPGFVQTRHPVYALAGPTAVLDGTAFNASPAASWVGVLEDLRPAVQGLSADDPGAVMDALRDHLYTNAWYIYNPNNSSYSSFTGSYIYWTRIWTEMSDFLDRRQGLNLYCHSVACLLASQANHWGIEAEYVTIVHRDHPTSRTNFRTWLTRAAGRTNWQRWTFNSHGITGLDGRVWDAAVDIDGDENPGVEPVLAVSPKGLPLSDYFELVTADPMVQVNGGRCHNY